MVWRRVAGVSQRVTSMRLGQTQGAVASECAHLSKVSKVCGVVAL